MLKRHSLYKKSERINFDEPRGLGLTFSNQVLKHIKGIENSMLCSEAQNQILLNLNVPKDARERRKSPTSWIKHLKAVYNIPQHYSPARVLKYLATQGHINLPQGDKNLEEEGETKNGTN